MMEKQIYIVTAHTEKNMGLLSRIAGIFLKRNIDMASFASSLIEADSALCFEIMVEVTEVQVKKITAQIEKQVEVMRVDYHTVGTGRDLSLPYSKDNEN